MKLNHSPASCQRHERVTKDDPWGYGNSLEWATSCPPPRHNFTKIPRIRSERPAFDLHYPHIQTGRTRWPVPPVSTAFCVSIVAVMRLRFAIRRAGQEPACGSSLLAPGNGPRHSDRRRWRCSVRGMWMS